MSSQDISLPAAPAHLGAAIQRGLYGGRHHLDRPQLARDRPQHALSSGDESHPCGRSHGVQLSRPPIAPPPIASDPVRALEPNQAIGNDQHDASGPAN